MIVDTHIHIWDLQRSSYDWLKEAPELLRKPYALADLEEQRIQTPVQAGVLVQADNSTADTELMLEVAEAHEWVKGVVGWLPLTDPGQTAQLLEDFVPRQSYFKGVRHLIHDEPDDQWLLQDTVIESLRLLAAHQLPFDLVGIHTTHIQTAIKVAEKVPDLKIVFDHLNQPPISSGTRFGDWGDWMKIAAQHPRCHVKISGMSTTSGSAGFTVESIKPYIEFVFSQFGPERCFCGGDWPVSLLVMDYSSTWKVYQEVIDSLLFEQGLRRRVYSDNARSFYNLDLL